MAKITLFTESCADLEYPYNSKGERKFGNFAAVANRFDREHESASHMSLDQFCSFVQYQVDLDTFSTELEGVDLQPESFDSLCRVFLKVRDKHGNVTFGSPIARKKGLIYIPLSCVTGDCEVSLEVHDV